MVNLTNEDEIVYEVQVDGKVISKNTNKLLAESYISQLNDDVKQRAIIVPVTKSGKQYLLD